MLYIVATPIGNLGDITYRSIEILKNCDYILCEDTRHSLRLLKHYNIEKPLKSYHKFNEAEKEASILNDLCDGKKIALISDAGTPGIADPGARLAKAAIARAIPVTSLPGPCAAICALSLSGFDNNKFQFIGFFPKKEKELQSLLSDVLNYDGITIGYESPNRLSDLLEEIITLDPAREIAVARELTKLYEELKKGPCKEVARYFKDKGIKGEIVILITPNPDYGKKEWEHLSIEEHVELLVDKQNISRKEAIKQAAEIRGIPKRVLYNQIMKKDI